MFKVFLVYLALIFSNQSIGQKVDPRSLFGEWNITGYKGLEIITPGMENNEEKNERLKLDLNRSKGVFHIDSSSISTNNQYLSFGDCKFNLIHENSILLIIVANDYSNGYPSNFDVDIDCNKVSKDFVKLFDKKYSKKTIEILDTDCKVDYGNSTLKICIIDNNKIGLYRDFDLIILERKMKEHFH